ncbi:MAG: MFS transporter [Proteobacteria bacterium]|nr:MFS transporter [Pseudomonadota bacterium]
MKQTKATSLGTKNWAVVVLLGLSGQIAWNVENSWFNTFVFDTITPDPKPIAVMVAVSAVVATLTTLLMGTLSDRIGKRKPFILIGYVFWALSTIAYPMSSWAGTVQLAIFLVVLLDAVMTFFGSTANDAAFNAWVTDITDETNRGTAEGVLIILPILAVILGMGLSGLLIDTFGYFPFFLTLGGMVMIMGLAGSFLLAEGPDLRPYKDASGSGYFRELVSVFSPSNIKRNRELYLVFLAMVIFATAHQIVGPYELIYLNNYLNVSKTTAGILTAIVAPILILFALPIGKLTDWGKGFVVITIAYVISAVGQFLFSMTDQLWLLGVTGALKSIGFLTMIVLGAWIRNLMPKDARGQFQGVRLIFMVMLPMVIGPAIGSTIIENYGIPTTLNGQAGFVPVPMIYQVSAVVCLMPLIPVFFLWRRCRRIGLKL